MANAPWPTDVPSSPLIDSFEEAEDENAKLRTPMDDGIAKVRNLKSTSVPTLSFEIHMTKAQVSSFKTFYRQTLGNGALPFDIYHPQEEVTLTGRFLSPYPRYRLVSDVYRYAMNVEILP